MLSGSGRQTGDQMNTILGKETTFTGTLEVRGGLRVDGVVKGKIISSDEVTIGSTGMVEAQIEANSVVVAGKLVGDIISNERIELQANCDVEGDLRSKSLVIEQGAVFCGGCNMKEGKANLNFMPAKEDNGSHTEEAEEKESSAFGLPFKAAKDRQKVKA
ncbi:MAG: polymer-forming cytoskeletal protein [Candidatus Zixiibacteriota bacterium]